MTPPNDDARLHVHSYFSLTNDVPHSVRSVPAIATSIYFYSLNQGTFVITIPSVFVLCISYFLCVQQVDPCFLSNIFISARKSYLSFPRVH